MKVGQSSNEHELKLNATAVSSKHRALYIKYVVNFGMICNRIFVVSTSLMGGHFHIIILKFIGGPF